MSYSLGGGGGGGGSAEALDHAVYRVLGRVTDLTSEDTWQPPLDTTIKSIDCYAGTLTGTGDVLMKLFKNNVLLETVTLDSSNKHKIVAVDYQILTTDKLHWVTEVLGNVACENITGRIKYVL